MNRKNSRRTTEKRLKYLYVLLGRICNKERYVWEGIDHDEQVDAFFREYEMLRNRKETSGRNLETRFTINSVLAGALTLEDRTYKVHKPLITHDEEDIEIKGETILHRAISLLNNKDTTCKGNLYKIIDRILTDLPFLLKADRKESPEYDGQSALHLAVLKEDVSLVEKVMDALKNNYITLDPVARGSKFKGTVMMAGTPLCVAALTFNKTIFKILVRKGANIAGTNEDLDNMCHSLIHYARYYPDRLKDITNMMDFIFKLNWRGNQSYQNRSETENPQMLLMMENKDGLNPLQLATKFQMHQIFKQLYGFEVYCERHLVDSLRDDHLYDVTEIETIPLSNNPSSDGKTFHDEKRDHGEKRDHASVLPAILLQNPQSAIAFLEFPPVRQVIELKWSHYRWVMLALGIMHLVFMIGLTNSAIMRTQLTNNPFRNQNESVYDPPNYKYRVGENGFVTFMCTAGLIYCFLTLFIEITRAIANHDRKVVKKISLITIVKYPHSNIIYRLLFILLSVCLCLDFILAISRVKDYENFFLMAAVIVGWYSLLFFIQMIEPFSFFTALIQTVMVDLFRFALVMVIMLIGFSTAMYMAMQGANTDDDTFQRYDSALLKMFTIMIGLGDLDSLFLARQPALAILIFTLFVMMTTILLLNAVIAVMSNTCSSLLSRYGNLTAYSLHYRLQRLSAILLVEDALPIKLQKSVGEVRPKKRFRNGKWYHGVKRRMLYDTILASNMDDKDFAIPGLAILIEYLLGRSNKRKGKEKISPRIAPNPTDLFNGTATVGDLNIDIHTMKPGPTMEINSNEGNQTTEST